MSFGGNQRHDEVIRKKDLMIPHSVSSQIIVPMVTELAAVTAMTWVDYDKDEDKNGEVMIIVHVMGNSRSAPAGQGQTLQSVQIQSVLLIHFYS